MSGLVMGVISGPVPHSIHLRLVDGRCFKKCPARRVEGSRSGSLRHKP